MIKVVIIVDFIVLILYIFVLIENDYYQVNYQWILEFDVVV